MAEAVERAALDQRLDRALVERLDLDSLDEIDERLEGATSFRAARIFSTMPSPTFRIADIPKMMLPGVAPRWSLPRRRDHRPSRGWALV